MKSTPCNAHFIRGGKKFYTIVDLVLTAQKQGKLSAIRELLASCKVKNAGKLKPAQMDSFISDITKIINQKTTKEQNKTIILAAIEDCKIQKASGISRYDIENGLKEIGFTVELSMFIASVVFS